MQYLTTLWVLSQNPAMVLSLLELSVVQVRRSWQAAHAHCRNHFVDLVVADTVARYDFLLQEMGGESGSLWIGLHNSAPGGWQWVDGGALSYSRWYRESPSGLMCGSVDRDLNGPKRLLPRLCHEHHAFVCQGATPPDRVEVEYVGADAVSLRWDRPPIMHNVSYSFNISVASLKASNCTSTLSSSTSTLSSGLQPGSPYTFCVSTVTDTAVQSRPACVTVTTRLEAPVKVRVDSIDSSSVSLSWADQCSRADTPCQYKVSYSSLGGDHSGVMITRPRCSHIILTGLRAQTEYLLNISAVNLSGASSVPVTVFIFTSAVRYAMVSMVLRAVQCVLLVLLFWLLCYFHCKTSYAPEKTEDTTGVSDVLLSNELSCFNNHDCSEERSGL
ncbi:hypothetical protein AAFF_G00064990 [Aldrovandia affinis]|uniref:Uncharacterized protein n=1 Tax=Aldrovandia affinis TaxID=143900 RepID=A0AAD7T5H1_9TELE|nr:hypothetical protein AAFF_G00064990 [Aldrovandia affinis]